MTKDQKESFGYGIFVGLLIAWMLITIMWVAVTTIRPEEKYRPSALLNDPEWYIDTTKTIHQGDTIETYCFARYPKAK